ncbi:MAG: hypothetical protein U1E78_01330 [Gammaproteobacteria bacterium]|jgi:hypothetical protein
MTTTIQDVKPTRIAQLGLFLWRYRMMPGLKWVTLRYIKLVRQSLRWWLQVCSLFVVSVVMIHLTVSFGLALVQSHDLRETGKVKVAALEHALHHIDEGDTFQLALAQRALLEHIALAKKYDRRFPVISMLGVDTEKSQVCPFSKILLSSIEEGFILPARLQLEEGLNGFYKNWMSQDQVTRDFLYPVYLENFQFYVALKQHPSEADLWRLAHYWYQSLSATETDRKAVNVEDLKLLLAYYFKWKKQPVATDTELVAAVEKQLEGYAS